MSAPTKEQTQTARDLLASLGDFGGHLKGDDIAHLEVHGNEVVGAHLVPGLQVDVDQLDEGIEAWIHLDKGAHIVKPVHLCFGMLPTEGLQRIVMHVEAEEDSFASVQAHCTFPNAVDITHKMDADVVIGPGATYEYFERHLHGAEGGVTVAPKTRVHVKEGARFKTEFELIKGHGRRHRLRLRGRLRRLQHARHDRPHHRSRARQDPHQRDRAPERRGRQSRAAVAPRAARLRVRRDLQHAHGQRAARSRPRRLQRGGAGERRRQGRPGGRGDPPARARDARGCASAASTASSCRR